MADQAQPVEDLKGATSYESLGLDNLLQRIKQEATTINAGNIDELIEDGIISQQKLSRKNQSVFTSNIQIYKRLPAVIFNAIVSGDTDWYVAVNDDGSATSDDELIFGTGTTPGSNIKVTFDADGNVNIANGDLILNNQNSIEWEDSTTPTQGISQVYGRSGATNFNWSINVHPYSYIGYTLGLLGWYHTESPLSNKLVLASDANIKILFGNSTDFVPGGDAGQTGFYYSMYLFSSREFYMAADSSNYWRVFGHTAGYIQIGDEQTGAAAVGLKLYGGSATERMVIESDGSLKYLPFSVAGFVKNSAAGLITGGNSITVADITDLATTYLKLDGTNMMTGSVNIDSDSAGLILGADQDIILYAVDPSNLWLKPQTADTDLILNFYGTTNSGIFKWMEDEDYFQFMDSLLIDAAKVIYFRDTALGIFSQADGYLNIFADTGIRLGDSTPTNYTQFDSTGHQTMVGTAKPWDDLRIEPVARTTGANAPTFEKWYDDAGGTSRGVYLYSFDDANAGSEKEIFFTMQMPHSWDLGNIEIHVHWVGAVDDTTSAPRWGLEYAWKEIGEVFGDTTTVYSDGSNYVQGGTEADITLGKHYISKFAEITADNTQNTISSILVARLFRDSANAADTYNAAGAKCGLLYIDAHIQMNSLGSTDEYTK